MCLAQRCRNNNNLCWDWLKIFLFFFLFYFFIVSCTWSICASVCVICFQWMTFTTATFMWNFCCCHLWAKLHVQIGRILHISSRLCHRKESECERHRKQQHTRIAKVMGNYKGTGWQLCLQSSEPDEATYFCCQLACSCERICDTQTVHSIEVQASSKRVEMPLWLPIYETTSNITPPFWTLYFKRFRFLFELEESHNHCFVLHT